jgi:hypothetical protein
VLPKQIVNVTPDSDLSLRGVGFRSGTYTDTPGITPLTGAPATEQNGIHTSFASSQFLPQSLATANYFGELTSGPGHTSLIVNPVQYRADAPGSTTDVQRTYSHLDLALYYSANTTTYGANTPALAAPPSIAGVSSSAGLSSVTVSAHVTGDPSAGIQQVWMTYTAESGAVHGTWDSLDFTQDAVDSTLWSGTLQLPAGQDPSAVRFMLQAANGVGTVGLDNNLGALYVPGVAVGSIPDGAAPTSLHLDPVPASVAYGSSLTVGATLTGAPAGSLVSFDIGGGPVVTATDASGHAGAAIPVSGEVGVHVVTAVYAGDATHRASSDQSAAFTEVKAPTTLVIGASGLKFGSFKDAPKAGPAGIVDTRLFATLRTSTGQPLPQKSVLFTITTYKPSKVVLRVVRTTDLNGVAKLTDITIAPGIYVVTASFGTTAPGSIPDPVYAASSASPWYLIFVPRAIAIRIQ